MIVVATMMMIMIMMMMVVMTLMIVMMIMMIMMMTTFNGRRDKKKCGIPHPVQTVLTTSLKRDSRFLAGPGATQLALNTKQQPLPLPPMPPRLLEYNDPALTVSLGFHCSTSVPSDYSLADQGSGGCLSQSHMSAASVSSPPLFDKAAVADIAPQPPCLIVHSVEVTPTPQCKSNT